MHKFLQLFDCRLFSTTGGKRTVPHVGLSQAFVLQLEHQIRCKNKEASQKEEIIYHILWN